MFSGGQMQLLLLLDQLGCTFPNLSRFIFGKLSETELEAMPGGATY